jgi:putative nucleotidyltransferase with HDIG domain
VSRPGHLLRRFVSSLRARPLDEADLEFVRRSLRPEELDCWERLGRADRAESVATGRAVARTLGADADPRWIAAALLHDVGKAETTFGVIRRSVATVVATGVGARRARTWRGAFGRYVNHDELGASRLREAGARPEAVAWAAAHHRAERWSETGVPVEICEILAAADGEPTRQ